MHSIWEVTPRRKSGANPGRGGNADVQQKQPSTWHSASRVRSRKCDSSPISSRSATAEARRVLSREPTIRAAVESFKRLDVALVVLAQWSHRDFSPVAKCLFRGGAGEVRPVGRCRRHLFPLFDARGVPIKSPLMQRVIGIEATDLRAVDRVIASPAERRS